MCVANLVDLIIIIIEFLLCHIYVTSWALLSVADTDTLMTWNVAVRWSESERDQTVGDVTSLGRSSINHQVSLLAAVVTPTLPCSTTSSSCCSSHVACCLFFVDYWRYYQ